MTCPRAYAQLYAGRPYGVTALPFDPRSLADHRALRSQRGLISRSSPATTDGPRSRALDARWIVAFTPDAASYKDWSVDEMRPMPETPMAWGEIAARLIDGPQPEPYSPRVAGTAVLRVHAAAPTLLRAPLGASSPGFCGHRSAGWPFATGPRPVAWKWC